MSLFPRVVFLFIFLKKDLVHKERSHDKGVHPEVVFDTNVKHETEAFTFATESTGSELFWG